MQLVPMRPYAAPVPGRLPGNPLPFFRTVQPLKSRAPEPQAPAKVISASPSPAPDVDPALPRDIASRFGRRIRELRHARRMTQLEVAVTFGIDRTFISDVERGRKGVCLPTLEVFALGFGVSLSDLLRGL